MLQARASQRVRTRYSTPASAEKMPATAACRRAGVDHPFAGRGGQEKRLAWIEGGGHVITVDSGRAKVFEEVKTWIKEHSARKQCRPDCAGRHCSRIRCVPERIPWWCQQRSRL